MSRHRSRHRAVQVLYGCDIRKTAPEESISQYYGGLYTEESEEDLEKDPFMEELVHGVFNRRPEIDKHLDSASENWRVERMPAVDRNILRLAVFELLEAKLPAPVVIDEALELARRFSGEEAVPFVNGVLDGVRKQISAAAS
ncbi:MAG: transcription antitermination factor NusB [Bryobacteraceae bacterium]|nr:transcription antitermination factor NusB [Bryobacteraceae bacterium]